jgi:hypothetical protein
MRAVVVHHHLGLGDHLICNGLVYALLEREEFVYLAAKRRYLDAVRCLYADEPRVEVFPVDQEPEDVDQFARERQCRVVRIGFEACDRDAFDQAFYRQMDVPFEDRYRRFRLPRTIPGEDVLFDRLAPSGDYCLTHREGTVGLFTLRINSTLPRIDIRAGLDPNRNLLAYRKLILRAREIHCINSSVLHLVDSIDPPAALYYHAVRRTDFELRPRWTVVRYSTHPVLSTWRRAVARGRLVGAKALGRVSQPVRDLSNS